MLNAIRLWAIQEALGISLNAAGAVTSGNFRTVIYNELIGRYAIQEASATEAYEYAVANPPGDANANAGGDICGDVTGPTEGQLATESLVVAAQLLRPGAPWHLVRVLQPQATNWHPVIDDLYGTQSYGTPDSLTENWSIPWHTGVGPESSRTSRHPGSRFQGGSLNIIFWTVVRDTVTYFFLINYNNRVCIQSIISLLTFSLTHAISIY